jgi:hypothetical protein
MTALDIPALRARAELAKHRGVQMVLDHDTLAALLDAAEAMQWRDIATAPKDGVAILLCSEAWITVGCWNKHRRDWCCVSPSYDAYPRDERPTRWMPLTMQRAALTAAPLPAAPQPKTACRLCNGSGDADGGICPRCNRSGLEPLPAAPEER